MTKNAHSSGRFAWHDLMTSDPKAAIAFYSELVGWKTHDVDMGPMGKYTMIKAGDRDIGGIVPLEKGQNVPSHWLAYVTVQDADKAAKRVIDLGGRVAVPPSDIPTVGRFTIVSDTEGATLSPIRFVDETPPPEGKPALGTFCWNELMTADPKKALSFYESVFGWTHEDKDMGPMGTYHVLKRGDAQAAGVMKNPSPMPSHWLGYLLVASVDQSTKRAESLKATVHAQPMDIPGIGRFSVISDPTGAAVALFQNA